jgi:hypothetical protein
MMFDVSIIKYVLFYYSIVGNGSKQQVILQVSLLFFMEAIRVSYDSFRLTGEKEIFDHAARVIFLFAELVYMISGWLRVS